MRRRAGALLVAGATSDAGKTLVTTGLCRALARRGLRVAPFKAQNMSNNSMVTADGAEIGRAQWVQAVAAGAEPEAAMNPVLLKPGSDHRSHVVLMGRPHGQLAAGEFASGRERLREAAFAAYEDLCRRYDAVVCEGAGGVAEINLRSGDFVNLGLARHGAMPTVVVGDIDRGGVFASLFGSLALLGPQDQALVAGFVVNKFRGDVGLLRPGLRQLESLTGRPVLGVLPWAPDLWWDSEDTLAIEHLDTDRRADPRTSLRVAVVRLPRISNFTDVDALALEPDVELSYADTPRALASADLVVLPGTRSTMADLAWLRARGLAEAVLAHHRAGGAVLGLCGGYQMLGRQIEDRDGVEGPAGARAEGLGLLDVATTFLAEKVLRLPTGSAFGAPASGYEIHHGRVRVARGEPFLGGVRDGAVLGTMWHGSLEGDALRAALLREVASHVGREGFRPGGVSFARARTARLDRLGDLVEEHLNMDRVCELVTGGVPAGLPVLTAALAAAPAAR
ncbi:cobyric acid synthase [Ornithinicoccus halotolerans]|uniref:cobyric acid synthase n=1 Tax=Ornithinicoccus halotolerans TaxID=1748220 RepID=UPI001E29F588|nr:cobyric acid synthase [Ornithinicoccus halotolerans]